MRGEVGPITYGDGGTPTADRFGRLGDKIYSELHGRYYENTARGNVFFSCSQAVATTSVGLATTYTGLCLSNPIGSTRNLALLFASVAQSVIQSGQVEGYLLAVGSSPSNVTHTTPATVQTGMIGAPANGHVGLVDTAATLPAAPLYALPLTNTVAATQNSPGAALELAGAITLAPGGFACLVTPGQASVAGMWFAFAWAEVPQ